MLRAGGALGPWMQACFASLVMYYVERREADVARAIRIKMIEAYNMHFKGVGDADAVLSTWSKKLRRQFDLDNLHLATREDKPSHTLQALVAAVTQLSTSVKEGADGVANSLKDINTRLQRVEDSVQKVQQQQLQSAHAPDKAVAAIPVAGE